jgi:aminoglycoside phosphotransferase family enzyme
MSTITDTGVVAGLVAALTPPGGAEPELRQTHLSWVFLTAGRAYKLKKPVRFDFLDLRKCDARAPPARRRCA